ncbi:Fibrinogen-like protein 1 [Chionoecetes opilio]|uniref:Fibrinogen-like protein 1 n=1 Tax=Chionoecetes opilio TaxID=41210 RepID=A0A8J4YDW3_CHIOP|nr:Fibrinogen-like protein 1 [Chionoecetes opilio]
MLAGHAWWLVCVVCAVCGSLRASAALQDPDYHLTMPEDPLQSVWDNLDTIPPEILKGFKEQMELHNRQVQASLAGILARLSTLEDKLREEVSTLREDIGDFVTDRLVNAEAMIKEDLSKLSTAVTSSVRENCDLRARVLPLKEELAGMVNATTCSTQAVDVVEEAAARVEQAAARVEEAGARVEQAAARVEEASAKVEEDAVKVEAAAAKVEEAAAKVEEDAVKVEAAAAKVEEAAAKVEEDAVKVEAAAAKVEEAAAKVEEDAVKVEAAAARVEEAAGSVMHGNTTDPPAGYTTVNAAYWPRDCSDLHWQLPEAPTGVYQTFPTLDPKDALPCRSWVEYRQGFGQAGEGEWWYGLAPLHSLTYRQPFQVEFILHDLERGTFHAAYSTFRVESEGSNYRLLASGFSGNVSYDALASMHHGEPFSTYDKDLDAWDEGNCAANNGGGWWYKQCHRATLTATFPAAKDRDARTIRWYTSDGWLVFDDVTVKIRPANYGHRFDTPADGE